MYKSVCVEAHARTHMCMSKESKIENKMKLESLEKVVILLCKRAHFLSTA